MGYNDANVNYAYGVDVKSIVNVGGYSRKYDFDIKEGNINKIDTYNRGVYFPITDDSGKAIAAAAKETILNTNGDGHDRKDYKLFLNNCDQNASRRNNNRYRKSYSTEHDIYVHDKENRCKGGNIFKCKIW